MGLFMYLIRAFLGSSFPINNEYLGKDSLLLFKLVFYKLKNRSYAVNSWWSRYPQDWRIRFHFANVPLIRSWVTKWMRKKKNNWTRQTISLVTVKIWLWSLKSSAKRVIQWTSVFTLQKLRKRLLEVVQYTA